jgi:DNA helicase-2/ATP-dependent DNA helicase PcrA
VVRNSGLIAMWSAENDEDALANADELITAAAEYDRQHPEGDGSVAEWLQQIALVSDVDAIDETLGAVTLMTMHSAKGLEFDTVFMVGMEEGLMPHERSIIERADAEEERRLCFVGMTRAKRVLVMSWAKWREFRGISERRLKSLFLRELPEEQVEWLEVGTDGESRYDTEDDGPEVPASSADFADWRKGQMVRHPEYGIGRLLWIEPRNRKTRAGILFNEHGEKTLILEYANLELIEADDLEF